MTETKIAESSNHKLFLANPYYEVYTANSNAKTVNKQESSMGSALAVQKTLQPYINNILKVTETAIAVDFFFPRNQRIRVISIYLTTTNKILKEEMQRTVADWVRQAVAKDYNVVMMGDFNLDGSKEKKLIPLFKAADQLGL